MELETFGRVYNELENKFKGCIKGILIKKYYVFLRVANVEGINSKLERGLG